MYRQIVNGSKRNARNLLPLSRRRTYVLWKNVSRGVIPHQSRHPVSSVIHRTSSISAAGGRARARGSIYAPRCNRFDDSFTRRADSIRFRARGASREKLVGRARSIFGRASRFCVIGSLYAGSCAERKKYIVFTGVRRVNSCTQTLDGLSNARNERDRARAITSRRNHAGGEEFFGRQKAHFSRGGIKKKKQNKKKKKTRNGKCVPRALTNERIYLRFSTSSKVKASQRNRICARARTRTHDQAPPSHGGVYDCISSIIIVNLDRGRPGPRANRVSFYNDICCGAAI